MGKWATTCNTRYVEGLSRGRFRGSRISLFVAASLLVLGIGEAIAESAPESPIMEQLLFNLNTVSIILLSLGVLWMQLGFGMMEAGLTRARNATNILMKTFIGLALVMVAYWAFGFALMFGPSMGGIVGREGFFLIHANARADGAALHAHWFFQAVTAAAVVAIVTGGLSERTRFPAYLIVGFLVGALIYPVVGHWIWGEGWLRHLGFIDFAGGTLIHSVGGWAALVGTLILGPRLGKYDVRGRSHAIPGHNIPLSALGVLILWVGWVHLNVGRAIMEMGAQVDLIAQVAVNTNLAAAAGALSAMVTVWLLYGKPETSITMNGGLAGLAAVAAGCNGIAPISAVILGVVGSLIAVAGVSLLDRVHVDDPVGAVSAHGFSGAWGTLAVGLFDRNRGLFLGHGTRQLGIQILGMAVVFMAACLSIGVLLLVLRHTIGLRVSEEEERQGLDHSEHRVESYSDFRLISFPH